MANKYFKYPAGLDVYAFAADGSEDHCIKEGMVPLSDSDLAIHLNPPPPPAEPLDLRVARALDAKLDALAHRWQYRDYISARSYVGDINPKFAAEGAAIAAHGSACWTVLDKLKDDVQSGAAEMPSSAEEVLAMLPAEPSRPAT